MYKDSKKEGPNTDEGFGWNWVDWSQVIIFMALIPFSISALALREIYSNGLCLASRLFDSATSGAADMHIWSYMM